MLKNFKSLEKPQNVPDETEINLTYLILLITRKGVPEHRGPALVRLSALDKTMA